MGQRTPLQPHPEFAEQPVLGVLKPAELYQLETLKVLLRKVFPRIEIVCPKSLDHLHDLLRRCRITHPLILAIGGDGTLHQVMQKLNVETQVLSLLPLGTGNDYARTIGYPKRLRDKIARLSQLKLEAVDFGTMAGHRFINSAGFGLDSATLALREEHPKSRMLQNYNIAFIQVLASLKPYDMVIEIDEDRIEGSMYWALAMNTPFIGGGTRIAPQAEIADGLLDALLVQAASKWDLLYNLPRAIQGKHLGMRQVTYRKFTHMRCKAKHPVRYLAADGELHFHGEHVVEFRVYPRELRILSDLGS